jgi:hypothetical protein
MKDLFNDMPLSSDNDIPQGRYNGNGYDPYLSMTEYEELKRLLDVTRTAFAEGDKDIMPDPRIKRNLKALVAARRKRFEFPAINFNKVLNFPVPAYQVGLAMILMMFTVILAGKRSNEGMSQIRGVHKTDTIYEKIYKKSSTIVASNDSQAKSLVPTIFKADYTDSIDMDFEPSGNQNDNATHDNINTTPQKQPHSSYQDLTKPDDANTPEKGGGRYLEDTSKLNRPLHG